MTHSFPLRRIGSWLAVCALLLQLGAISLHGAAWGETDIIAGSLHHLLHGHDHAAESFRADAAPTTSPGHFPGCPICGTPQFSRYALLAAEAPFAAPHQRISRAFSLGASTTANAGNHIPANPRAPPSRLS